jgi:alcohol dehydrogenase (cytochrome c)
MKNLAIYGDWLYAPTPDGHVIALETKTGKLIWDHAVMSRDKGLHEGAAGRAPFSMTGGPVVAKGKVIIGTSLGINTGGGNYIFDSGHKYEPRSYVAGFSARSRQRIPKGKGR